MAIDRRILNKKLNNCQELFEVERLELILQNAFPNLNTRQLATFLIDKFETIEVITKSTVAQLTFYKEVPVRVARYLSILGTCYYFEPPKKYLGTIKSLSDFVQIAVKDISQQYAEYIEILIVDSRNRIVFKKLVTDDNLNQVKLGKEAFIDIFKYALGKKLYIAHNHIDATPQPSESDNKLTKRLLLICAFNDIEFVDHIIVNNRDQYFSYEKSGVMAKYRKVYNLKTYRKVYDKVAQLRAKGVNVESIYLSNPDKIRRDFLGEE